LDLPKLLPSALPSAQLRRRVFLPLAWAKENEIPGASVWRASNVGVL
jgi:hypothetical protein